MEVFFSPIQINDKYTFAPLHGANDVKLKSYPNFAYIKFYDLNILCDCPLICRNDLDAYTNQELIKNLSLDQLHGDTLFPATFLFNEPHSNESENSRIEVDLILISNPNGLTGVPFLLHYNNYHGESNSTHCGFGKNTSSSNYNYNKNDEDDDHQNELDYHTDDEEFFNFDRKSQYMNIYQWLDKYPVKFDIRNSRVMATPPVYQSAIVGLQQLIEYYGSNEFNHINDPFSSIKTTDLYNILASDLINIKSDILDSESLKMRYEIFSNLPENGPEYYYIEHKNYDNASKYHKHEYETIDEFGNTIQNEVINPRGSTTGFGAAVNPSAHIYDGNVFQNMPAAVGCNTSNSSTFHPPLFGNPTGEEMSYIPRMIFELQASLLNKLKPELINNKFASGHNNRFQIELLNIGQVTQLFKNFSKFNIHFFNSGFCLGGVGFHISTNNMDYDIKKETETLVIIGPTSLEFDRYPAQLCLGGLSNCNNFVFYGNFVNNKPMTSSFSDDLFNFEDQYFTEKTLSSILPIIKMKRLDRESKDEDSKTNYSIKNHNENNPNNKNKNKNKEPTQSYLQMQLDNIVEHILDTLKNNGSILIPIDCPGLLCLEVVEFIGQKISELSMPIQAPMYIVGGGISSLLLGADVSAEWTSTARTRKVMLPNPSPPFIFSFLIKSNRLYVFHTTSELSTVYREPAIFFATNSDLKFGPSNSLFKELKNNPNNAIIIIDSYVDFEQVVNNFKKESAAKFYHYPVYIEPNISSLIDEIIPYFNQSNQKFNFIIPHNVVSESILSNNKFINDENRVIFGNSIKMVPTTNKVIFNSENQIFEITGDWINVTLAPDVIKGLEMKHVSPNLCVGKAQVVFNQTEGELFISKIDNESEICSNKEETNRSNICQSNSEINTGCSDINEADSFLIVDDFDDLFVDDFHDISNVQDEQPLLFGNITLKQLIKELKRRKLDEIIVNCNDVFQDEKATSISIQSIDCKIIMLSSNNVIINSGNRESRNLIHEVISSLLTSV